MNEIAAGSPAPDAARTIPTASAAYVIVIADTMSAHVSANAVYVCRGSSQQHRRAFPLAGSHRLEDRATTDHERSVRGSYLSRISSISEIALQFSRSSSEAE